MKENLIKLIADYEEKIKYYRATNFYEDSDMYFGMQDKLEEVVKDLKKLLKECE